MNIAETASGSSRKGQENGDASNDCERPLKKARFAWQVKGKYHLKNDENVNEATKTSTLKPPEPDIIQSSSSGNNCNNRGTEQKLDMLGDYFGAINSDINVPDQSLLNPITSIGHDRLPYPQYNSTFEQNIPNNKVKSESGPDLSAHTSKLDHTSCEDRCIAGWQTKQLLKSIVDNTINCVLDTWMQSPDDHARSAAIDVADFLNNLPRYHSVENEGILMAISAHGLQHPGSSVIHHESDDDYVSTVQNDSDDFQPLTPLPSDDESHEPLNNNQCDTDTSSTDLDMTWSYCDDQKNDSNDTTPFTLLPDVSSFSCQGANDSHQNSSIESDAMDNPVNNDCDFLDAAILFAIQNKGLTTFGSDYG